MKNLVPWSIVFLILVTSCGDDDGIAGSGTGGDEVPEDEMPGPGGPNCTARVGHPYGSPDDVTARDQPGTITGVVTFREDLEPVGEPPTSNAGAPAIPLTATGRPAGATTKHPHVHERWGESRKLELSYCITGLYGDDAEIEDNYHSLIRSVVDTTAEWERITGANFVHVAEDDTPEQPPDAVPGTGNEVALRANCAAGTAAYLAMLTYPFGGHPGDYQPRSTAVE